MSLDKIVLGTAQLDLLYGINNKSDRKKTKSEALHLLNSAYESGIRSLDTARAYGHALEIIGECNKDFKIYSKFLSHEQDFFSALKEQKSILKKQHLHCLSFHRFSDFFQFSQWETLRKQEKDANLWVGVSVANAEEGLAAIESGHIQLIQLPFNVFDNMETKKELFQASQRHDVAVQVRSIFLQGLVFMDGEELPPHLQELSSPLIKLQEIAQKHSLSIHELCLRYALSFQEIHSLTFGVDDTQQLNKNLKVAKQGSLASEIISKLHAIKISDKSLLNPATWPPRATVTQTQ